MAGEMRAERDSIQYFLQGYRVDEPPQSLTSSSGDFQLASIRPLIGEKINSEGYTKLFDIGCGNAVLLKDLSDLKIFESSPDFKYIGIDFEENLREAHGTALELKLYRGFELYPISYNWKQYAQDGKSIFFFRNVFHELTISETAEYIEFLSSCKPDDCIIVQDMTTLPVAERSRAGWMDHLLLNAFTDLKFHAYVYPNESKSGIKVFVLTAYNQNPKPLDLELVEATLTKHRRQQLLLLNREYSNHGGTYDELGRARLLHDIYAISKQLNIPLDRPNTVAPELVRLALIAIKRSDVFEATKSQATINSIDYFQNRGHPLQKIDEFMLSDSMQVLIVIGGRLIGKKTLINQALTKFKHDRIPVYITLSEQISALSVFEQIIEQLGATRYLDIDILSSSTINFEAMLNLLQDNDLFERIASNTVLVFREIETICDSNKAIENKDFLAILENWTLYPNVKIIIDSQYPIFNIGSLTKSADRIGLKRFHSHDNSTFGKNQYPVQMLQELVPIPYRNPQYASTGGFPEALLDIIDNHPYIAFLSSLKIKQCDDVTCLSNNVFIDNVQNNILRDLVNDFNLSNDEMALLRILLTLNDSYDTDELHTLADSYSTVENLIEKGVLILRESGQQYSVLPIFITSRNKSEVFGSDSDITAAMYAKLTKQYQTLYNKSSAARHFRKYIYFCLLEGDGVVTSYALEQASEITETLFREREYSKALFFYQEISKYKPLTSHQQMRKASCLIRTNTVQDGLDVYSELFRRYPDWTNLRHSCVDALFFLDIDGYAKDAIEILNLIPQSSRTDYWFYQTAKASSALNQKSDAFECYSRAIELCSDSEKAVEWAIEAISFANTTYEQIKAQEYINLLEHQPYVSQYNALIEIGSHYEKAKEPSKAISYLEEAYARDSYDPYIILPLVKAYCALKLHDKAKDIITLGETNRRTVKSDVFKYAQVCYYKSKKEFIKGEVILAEINSDKTGIHFMTQWTEFYYEWLLFDNGNSKANARVIRYADEIRASKDIPSKITLLKVFQTLGNAEEAKELSNLISKFSDS